MSTFGEGDADLFGQFILEADPEQIKALMEGIGDLIERVINESFDRANRSARQTVRVGNRRVADEYRRSWARIRQEMRAEFRRMDEDLKRQTERIRSELRRREREHVSALRRQEEAEKQAGKERLHRMEAEERARDRQVRQLRENVRRFKAQLDAMTAAQNRASAERLQQRRTADARDAREHDHALKQERNRDREAHHLRLEAQKQQDKRELQQTRAHHAAQADARRHANRLMLTMIKTRAAAELAIVKGTQARLTAADRAAAAERLQRQRAQDSQRLEQTKHSNRMALERQKAADRIRLVQTKAAEDRQTQAEAAAQQERLARQAATEQRRLARSKAFWSASRSIVESGGRAIISTSRDVFSRLFLRQRSHEARSLGSMQSTESRRWGILRRSSRRQEQIVNASLIRQQGLYQASQQASMAGSLRFFTGLRNAALGFGGGFLGLSLLRPGIEFNVLQQRARAALGKILDDAGRANALFDELLDFSKTSPFPLQNFIQATQKLAAFGFEARQIVPTLATIQDAVAAFGGGGEELNRIVDVFAKIRSNGKITGEELNRLGDVGISALQILAEELGMTVDDVRKEISAGNVDADTAITALTAGMEKRFEGAAGAVKETWVGATDRIKAAWRDTAATIVAPFISPTGGGLAIDWANRLADGLRVVQRFITNLFEGTGSWEVARSALMGIGIALGLIVARRSAGAVLQVIGLALSAIAANPVIFGLGAVVTLLTVLIRHVPQVGDAFGATFRAITENFGRMREALGALLGGDFSTFAATFADIGRDIWTALEPALDFLRQQLERALEFIVPVVVRAWDAAFAAVAGFIRSGGIGRVRDAVLDALSTAGNFILGFLRSDIGIPVAAGLLALLSPLGLVGAAIVGGVTALVIHFRDRITDALGQIPGLLARGLVGLGRFLGDTVVSTVFSEVGIKIMAGIAAGVAASAGLFLFGLIDGLRRGIPSAVGALRDVVNDLLSAAFGGISDLPVVGDLLRVSLLPLEALLRGIMPTLELFARILGALPTPLLVAGIAILLFRTRIMALWTTMRTGATATTRFIAQLQMRLFEFGNNLRTMATQAQNSSVRMRGLYATVGNTGRVTAGTRALSGLGTVALGLGRALPGIGTAALIGLPIVLGLMEAGRARAERWKQEVKAISDQMAASGRDVEKWITEEALRNVDGFAEALNEAGIGVERFASIASGTDTAAIGEMFASINPRIAEMLDAAGVSMEEFGRAALEGDNAVDHLDVAVHHASGEVETLGQEFRKIPGPLRDVIDQANDAAEAFLDQQFAAGALTDEQVRLYTALKDGQDVNATYASIAAEVTDEMNRQNDVVGRAREIIGDLINRLSDASDQSKSFRDALDSVTGSAIEVGRSRQSIEGTFAAIRDAVEEGKGINDLGDQFLSAAEGIVGVFQTLSEAGRPREAIREYQRLRQRLIDQYVQLGLNRRQAEEFTSALVPPVDEIAREMGRAETAVLDGLRRQRRNLRRALAQGTLTGAGREAAEEMIGEIDAAIASYESPEIQVQARVFFESVRWDQTVAAYERLFREGRIDVGVNITPPRGRSGGLRGARGIAGPPGGDTDDGGDLVGQWNAVAGQVADILADMLSRFARFRTQSVRIFLTTSRSISSIIDKTMEQMVASGDRGATRFVSVVTRRLQAGAQAVGKVVRGYVKELTDAINPLLKAIGRDEVKIDGGGGQRQQPANVLGFAAGGIAPPRLARPGDGPIVHVYNEGRSGRGSAHGEAYIPFDPAYSDRARSIAGKAVSKLGGQVMWFEGGGFTGTLPNLSGDTVGLVPEFARRLSMWGVALGMQYVVGSGYRSFAEQARLYQRFLAGVPGQAPAAPPGQSMHNFGLASDGNRWSHLRPGDFGLRFPMSYEPWHVEPIEGKALLGDSHGWFMAMKPLPKPPPAGDHGVLSRTGAALMRHVYDEALGWAGTAVGTAAAPGLGAMAGNVTDWIAQAISIAGVPPSWAGPLATLVMRESGGNPKAYNGVLGASGLAQTIPSTFAAYHLPGLDDIWNPVHNLVAAIRYIQDRYGSIFNVGQAMSPTPTKGYRRGGITVDEGPAWLHANEVVLPLEDKSRLLTLLRATGLIDYIRAASGEDDLRRVDDRFDSWRRGDAPLIGEQHIHTNATDGEAIAVAVNSKIRNTVTKVRPL